MTVCESVQVCSWQSFSYSVSFSDFTVCLLYACYSNKQTYYFSSDNNTFLFLSLSFTHTQTHIVKKAHTEAAMCSYHSVRGKYPLVQGKSRSASSSTSSWDDYTHGKRGFRLPPTLMYTHTHKQTHIYPHWCQCTHKHVKGCIQVYKMLSGWTVWSINPRKYIKFPVTHYCLLSVYLVQLSFPHCLSHSIFSPSWNWHVCLLEECWLFHS